MASITIDVSVYLGPTKNTFHLNATQEVVTERDACEAIVSINRLMEDALFGFDFDKDNNEPR